MMYNSSHFNGKVFLNPVPTEVMRKGSQGRLLRKIFQTHPKRSPNHPLGPFSVDLNLLNQLPANGVYVTWLGHSSVLLKIDGKCLLFDPLWYSRASPFTLLGPKRFFPNPASIDHLPHIDALLLSHDHYDHLDKHSVLQLAKKKIPIITMLGVGQRLIKWGVDNAQVTELDWWQQTQVDTLTITSAPTRHFSGRWLNDRNRTLWGSFAIKSPLHNVYFGGDSGYYDGFKTIGEKLGPFDFTMLEIGAYGDEWKSIHMGPEAAVQANIDLKGKLLMPMHWATFNLAFHAWSEPIERFIPAADRNGVAALIPKPGVTYNIDKGAFNSQWWK